MIQRGVSILRETATRTVFRRPLDPFMLASVVDQLGGPAAACLNEIIKYFNPLFFCTAQIAAECKHSQTYQAFAEPRVWHLAQRRALFDQMCVLAKKKYDFLAKQIAFLLTYHLAKNSDVDKME